MLHLKSSEAVQLLSAKKETEIHDPQKTKWNTFTVIHLLWRPSGQMAQVV